MVNSGSDEILVTGATGRQGGAVTRELLRRGHRVRALVRDPDGDAARVLSGLGAALHRGDLEDPDSVLSAMRDCTGAFSVQTFLTPAGLEGEIRHGVTVADAARQTGAHVVYTSVDGAERNSGVPHFESKWTIEEHLRALEVPMTVLRPTFFMDNFAMGPATFVDGTIVVRLAIRPDKPLQMIASADVGVFAAAAFEDPERYIGRAVALAGDELAGPQIAQAFTEATGCPARYEVQPIEEIRSFSDDLALMLEWINGAGYDRADIAGLRSEHPGLRRLVGWLRETGWGRRGLDT